MVRALTEAQIIGRIERIEGYLRQLADHVGLPYDDGSAGVDPEVVAMARAGDRVRAAIRHAELTGVDFVTAQKVVNAL